MKLDSGLIPYTKIKSIAMRKNEIWPFSAMWMELEGIMLSEMSVRERLIPYVFTHMWISRNLTEDHEGG